MGLLDDELLRAAFGVFPQMQPRRRFQDPVGAANVPLDVTRGRLAGLLGLLPDALNFMGRSPMPTEMFGDTQYDPAPQMPYGSEYYLKNLPLKPTSRIGEVAGQAGAFVPLNPMPAARAVVAGAKALGPTAVGMGERYLQRQGLMPGVVPETPGLLGSIEKPQAPVSELGFYSATEQAALNIPRKSGTGESFLNDLMKGQDVKKDELSWMGLDDYLKGKPNVTRQEVQDFIASNRVDVQERQLGAAVAEDPVGIASRQAVFDKYEPEIQDLYRRIDKPEYVVYDPETNKVLKNYTNYDDALLDNLNPMGAFSKARTGLRPKENSRQLQAQLTDLQTARDAEANAAYVIPEPTPTRYQNYQLPGGENYREILLTLPAAGEDVQKLNQISMQLHGKPYTEIMADTSEMAKMRLAVKREYKNQFGESGQNAQDRGMYRSSHFNEPNILAHMRVNDRVDADGKKMLLIEEIQSDWHQAGREKGYKTKESLEKWYSQNKLDDDPSFADLNSEQRSVIERNRSAGMGGDNAVPDAPFKDTWHQLALKRALKYAADNGYDRVGLTTGRQQAERYDLSKQISKVMWDKETGRLTAYDKNVTGRRSDGRTVIDESGVTESKLSDYIGKEAAQKLIKELPDEEGVRFLSGLDLQVGGEGMKKYYDEIYPAFLAKQGKKYNAKTGETTIGKKGTIEKAGTSYYQTPDTNATVRYIDISPEMRGGVKKGQPLFTAAPIGGIGLGAGTQDNEMPDAVRQYMANPALGLLQDEEERKKLGGLLFR